MENSGVVFKWLKSNQKEIRNHRQNNGRTPNLQAHINKMHLNYIAMRPGAALNNNSHGLFGYIYDPFQNVLLDCDELKIKDILHRVGEMSKNGIDVFKTVISLKEDDAIQYGYTRRSSWKGLIEQKINEIARCYKINVTDLEWTASYHAENGHLHCHLLFWDRNQDLDNHKMPFVDYKKIRKSLSKEIFKDDYKKLLKLKNLSKEQLFNLTGKNIKNYKRNIENSFKNRIERKDEEWLDNFINEVMPGQISKSVFTHYYNKNCLYQLNERMSNLENLMIQENMRNMQTDKINYRYGYQTQKVKEYINDISTLILKTSPDCNVAFKRYVNDYIKVQKLIGDVEKNEDIEKIKYLVQNEVFNRMGNEILRTVKDCRVEENNRQKHEKFIEDYNKYLDQKLANNIMFNKLLIRDNTSLQMIERIFNELSNMSISQNAKLNQIRNEYSGLSKQAQKERAIQKSNSNGFDWSESQ